ncbi:MAG TPA: hypothetical protein VFQ98_02875 [Gallionella sp.]|nr:hypothetical protein [Gallionella sp.]
MIRYLPPVLIELALSWAEKQAALILRDGMPLDAGKIDLARSAGVAHPERIRLLQVARIPLPNDPQLTRMATAMGFLRPGLAGLTLGYGIYLRHGYGTPRILSHEFRHVYQYEQAGSIAAFLPEYLRQIAQYGYANAPLEVDARTCEAQEAVPRSPGAG